MKATVDRIEREITVLLLSDDDSIKFNLPLVLLPGIKEGDIVDITLKKDDETTRQTKERLASMIEKLKQKQVNQ